MVLEKKNGSKIRSVMRDLETHLRLKYRSGKPYFISNKKYFFIGIVLSFFVFFIGSGIDAAETDSLLSLIFVCFWLTPWSFYTFGFLVPGTIKIWMNFRGSFVKRLLQIPSLLLMTLFTLAFLGAEGLVIYYFFFSMSIAVGLLIPFVLLVNVAFFFLLKNVTPETRKILDSIKGFKQFLVATEKDRLNMLNPPEKTPELFEKYLPYALALDVEQRWGEQFSDILANLSETGYSPTWYSGMGAGLASASTFSSSFGHSFTDALSSSSPGLSSGGGGFGGGGGGGGSGGGGSSGGGGGGGGGGGW